MTKEKLPVSKYPTFAFQGTACRAIAGDWPHYFEIRVSPIHITAQLGICGIRVEFGDRMNEFDIQSATTLRDSLTEALEFAEKKKEEQTE